MLKFERRNGSYGITNPWRHSRAQECLYSSVCWPHTPRIFLHAYFQTAWVLISCPKPFSLILSSFTSPVPCTRCFFKEIFHCAPLYLVASVLWLSYWYKEKLNDKYETISKPCLRSLCGSETFTETVGSGTTCHLQALPMAVWSTYSTTVSCKCRDP